MNKRNKIIYVLKLTIGLILLIVLLFKDNHLSEIVNRFIHIKFTLLVLLLVNGLLMNLVSCLKWNLFLKDRIKDYKIRISRLFGLYMIGKFFNNFIPSMVGGDISRSILLGQEIESHSKSAASVFMERFTGLIAMLTLGILFSIINYKILTEPMIAISVAIIGGLTISILLTLYNEKFYYKITKYLRIGNAGKKLFKKIDLLIADISYFKNKSSILSRAMVYSFVFHVQTSVAVYLCCLSIGLNPSFLDVAVVTPIILLVVTIPVSPNNIGWWEWTFSVLLLNVGATSADGFTVALILRGVTFLFSIWGGILFLFEKKSLSLKMSTNS